MALVRVYCGVATAEMAPWLTVAVVDDAGRLLDMRHISDDPAGYAYIVALLAERSGGTFPVAVDAVIAAMEENGYRVSTVIRNEDIRSAFPLRPG